MYTHIYKTVNSILTFEAMPDTHSLMWSQSQRTENIDEKNIFLIHLNTTNKLIVYNISNENIKIFLAGIIITKYIMPNFVTSTKRKVNMAWLDSNCMSYETREY